MKKLFFTAALAFGSLTMIAFSIPPFSNEITMFLHQDFTEIGIEELPAAITEALAKDHPGTTIEKAFVNEEGTYKLEVTKENGSAMELHVDAVGKWLEK